VRGLGSSGLRWIGDIVYPYGPVRAFLDRLRRAAQTDRVLVTTKALDEAEEDLEWGREEVIACVVRLTPTDFERREMSTVRPSDTIWVFCPEEPTGTLWIRIVERNSFVIISFHFAGEP
jgi:hypothetical protein